MKISEQQVREAYAVAKRVYEGAISTAAGASSLHGKHGLNINSARDFIEDYKALLNGKLFQRAMSAPAMSYYLSRIEKDHGRNALRTATLALLKHITYYESISGTNLRKMRSVAAEFSSKLDQPFEYEQLQENFELAVEAARIRPKAERIKRLQAAPIQPKQTTALITVYVRNPDVVAAVLDRANGSCERCGKEAPFVRAKDGTPYLEVHHKIRLADKGEDTVKNAIALCPNCHRELHYGLANV